MTTKEENAKHQEAFRKRRAAQELFEVRGIYLPLALHPELKKISKSWLTPKQNRVKQLSKQEQEK